MDKVLTTQKWKIFNRYFLSAITISVTLSIITQAFSNTASLHIDALGFGATLSGALIAVGAITAFIYRIFGGSLTDRIGRRKLIVIGSFVFAVMSLLCGFAASIPLLIFFRVVQMIGYAIATTAISVMVVDVTPREKMSEGIGYFGLGNSLSNAITPTIALALFATALAFKAVMIFCFVLGIAGCLVAIFYGRYETDEKFPGNRLDVEKAAKNKKGEGKKLPFAEMIWTLLEKKSIPASIVALFSTIAGSSVFMFLTLYASKKGIPNAGLFFTVNAIATVVARLALGKLSDKYGILSSVLPGYFMLIVSFILLLVSPGNQIAFFSAGILFGFGQGMSAPALNAAAVKAAPPERRSAASSTFMIPMDIGFMIGSIIWGAIIDLVSFEAVFISSALSVVIALVLSIVFFSKSKFKAGQI